MKLFLRNVIGLSVGAVGFIHSFLDGVIAPLFTLLMYGPRDTFGMIINSWQWFLLWWALLVFSSFIIFRILFSRS